MEITQRTREGFTVLGILNRLNPMEADYRAIWHEQVAPRWAEMEALSSEPGSLTAFFGADKQPETDIITGVIVRAGTVAPPGLALRDIPGGPYVVAACRLEDTGATWHELFHNWKAHSEATIDFSKPTVEYYPPVTAGEEMSAEIWIPILSA
jgi:predicted transcriptional regulator YdeE